LLALLLTISITSCQREFADIKPPGIEIIEPDVSTVLTDAVVTLRIKPSVAGSVTGVSVGPVPMGFDPLSETWTVEITLNRGLNRLIFRSFGEVEPPQQDTVDLFHMPFEVTTASSRLRLGVGGHAATAVPGSGVVITGGSRGASGDAQDVVFLLPSVRDVEFIEVSKSMLNARVGHTATLIDDRRIVILGGGSSIQINSVGALVEEAELYIVDDRIFVPLPVVGDPIRRMYHTAVYRQTEMGPVVDLIGGTGDILYTPESLLGTRADVRSFLIRNDTLVSLSPAVGPFIERLWGHSQTDLGENRIGQSSLYLISGLGGGPPNVPVNIFVDYRSPLGILVDPAPQSIFPRNLHAAGRMGFGIVGLFGGRDLLNGGVLSEAELYTHETSSSFKLPQTVGTSFRGRYGHTASLIAPNVIMLAGGFDESGNVVDEVEFLTFAF